MQLQEQFKNKTKIDIKYELLDRLVKEKGYETVKKYIDNWHKFKHQSIKNILGFFVVAVTQEFDIPTSQNAYKGFEERQYSEEELNKFYANYLEN